MSKESSQQSTKKVKMEEEEEEGKEDGKNPSDVLPYALLDYVAKFLPRASVRNWKEADTGKMGGMVHKEEVKHKKMYYDIKIMVPKIGEQFLELYNQIHAYKTEDEKLQRHLQVTRGKAYRAFFKKANESTKYVYKQLWDYLEGKKQNLINGKAEDEQPLSYFEEGKFGNLKLKDVYTQLQTVMKTFNVQQSFSLILLLCEITQKTSQGEMRVFANVHVQRWGNSSKVKIKLRLQEILIDDDGDKNGGEPAFLFEISTEIEFPMNATQLQNELLRDGTFNVEDEAKYGNVASQQIVYTLKCKQDIMAYGTGGQLFSGSNFDVDQIKFMKLAKRIAKSEDTQDFFSQFANCYADFEDDDARDHLWNSRNLMPAEDASECIMKLMAQAGLPYRIKVPPEGSAAGGGGAAEGEGEPQIVMVSSFLDRTLYL